MMDMAVDNIVRLPLSQSSLEMTSVGPWLGRRFRTGDDFCAEATNLFIVGLWLIRVNEEIQVKALTIYTA